MDIATSAIRRFGQPNPHLSTNAELRFGRHGSVSVKLSGPKRGAWYDFESCEGGYLDHDEAERERPVKPHRIIRHESESAHLLERALKAVEPAAGTAAETYLRSRGIPHEAARSMLVEAFLTEATEGVGDEACRAALSEAVTAWWAQERA